MGSRVKKAFQTTFGSDPEEKESGQDSTSKNGNVFEDSRVLCVDQNLNLKLLLDSIQTGNQSLTLLSEGAFPPCAEMKL